ncbi:immune inhibitor A domain-containing protein [Nonomuraea mangrovi]|uniref:Immune inhibitor A domain-containing protein n=1 Tax=Nonomuraea mangrovi TaxID=2316207 RepID=A0ABW4SX66_9ACTN
MHSTKRLLAVLPALALLTGGPPPGQAVGAARYEPAPGDSYINYVQPAEGFTPPDPPAPGRNARARIPAREHDRKFSSGNPVTARVLAARENQAVRTGRNPADLLFKKSRTTKTARLLTILVEFNDRADDDFAGFERLAGPRSAPDDCVKEPPGTKANGPRHNRIPDPATLPRRDDFSFWVPDFSPAHYNRLLYSKQGVTARGVDLSGLTMRNMYEEMSKGAYSVTGAAAGWITVPHSEAWYGAAACGKPYQDMSGHPGNPRGHAQLPVDAVNALAAAQPRFRWSDYDIEDLGDADRDGDFDEPDGVIDHLVLVHAGKDKSADGGAQGAYALWAHSGAVAGGHPVPGTNLKVSNYIVQPEDAGVGVFAHEYGHDLGLPDLYDTSGAASSAVDFWDLMAAGSHAGPLYQAMPSHMGLWAKWVLGWADPEILGPGDGSRLLTIGQSSRTPRLTADGVRVDLPSEPLKMLDPHGGGRMWWSGMDQEWADVKLTRQLEVPAGAEPRLWMWNNFDIEADYDYGFVEVSTDGGASWAQQKVFTASGGEVSTPDDYTDPNKALHGYGGKRYGLTGTTNGWRRDYVDLSPFAGETIRLRLAYNTDAGTTARGWFADDLALTSGSVTVWSDGVERGADGWVATGGTFTNTAGQGWTVSTGSRRISRFYLAEWRNLDGFDRGLAHAYDTSYLRDGAWKVERVKYNAPGLLIWLRDSTYANNVLAPTLFDGPSLGVKGGLLLVDSHYEPLRRTGKAAAADPRVRKNLDGRVQSSNAAFSSARTYPFRECVEGEPFTEHCASYPAQKGVPAFTDARTWYPGLDLVEGSLDYRDFDASAVIPAKGAYSTRVVDADGGPATELYGTEIAGGHVLGTGDPGERAFGVRFALVTALPGNLGAIVRVTPPKK